MAKNETDGSTGYVKVLKNGTATLGEIPIGSRVVDPSWEWVHRQGYNNSDIGFNDMPTPLGKKKPVIWLVVARDHYDIKTAHVTLMAEGIIGCYAFENSTNFGNNNWGGVGIDRNANVHSLRGWLNSNGSHVNKGFYNAFSKNFKQAVIETPVPNREWNYGNKYITIDNVFIFINIFLEG